MRVASTLTIFFLLSVAALGADPEPYLKSAPMPFYPPLARQARIEGTVSVNFIVDADGNTSEVGADGGHQLLKQAATQNIQGWRFGWPQTCACRVKRKAILEYKLQKELEKPDKPSVLVRWFSKTSVIRVVIEAYAPVWQPQGSDR
jgi:TonB family protein